LGGDISLHSDLGQGSTFKVSLPILKEIPDKTTSILNSNPNTDQVAMFDVVTEGDKPLLLIAEDNYDVASYLAYCLKEDYELMLSYNGVEAAQMAIDHLPDIIISDVMMPEKNGFELTEELKSHPTTSHIPIILLSGRSDVDSQMTGIDKGADAYLSKPFRKDELLLRLKKLFESRRLLQAKYSSVDSEEQQMGHGHKEEDPFLTTVRNLILDNIEETGLQITDLTSQMYVTHVQLYRKIKALTGLTPTQFIRQVRLNKAIDLLKNTNLIISEVAYKTGFSDPNYFSRLFKKEFNQSPGEFRSTLE